ncbi:hypothetical protein A3J56_01630 [Candidatus Giovannonibacteria bacterium RIFCSPHIGHO2_02_FULL_46_20]|uniref:Uncharacterized protein n=1 Tax=Candidatus Giovannonibacteria bacterium RIFCSPHIGHO2_02_FULL_46_20 TaxID=1798338 RepID=A0A1F5WFE8_9BACT|nr:MAG: hypothetical protein A3J56_01630 [Candidatus Giovannonibacteria bacterium RIFCSPHIGHO2_02_FULL_46_20]
MDNYVCFGDATTAVLSLLRQLGQEPEKSISSNSPPEDFFNLVVQKRGGSRMGIVGIKLKGKPLQRLEIILRPAMTHRDLHRCLLSGIMVIIMFAFASAETLETERLFANADFSYKQ